LSAQVTLKGNPVELTGEEIKKGQKIPVFETVGKDLQTVSSEDFKGKVRIIASVPSLDTPICDMELNRFDEYASSILDNVAIIFVSMDLPFAQSRFCEEKNIDKVVTLSDHRDADFGEKFGVLIKEIRLLARAIFIVDESDIVQYAEYVSEVTSHPDYEKALEVVKSLA